MMKYSPGDWQLGSGTDEALGNEPRGSVNIYADVEEATLVATVPPDDLDSDTQLGNAARIVVAAACHDDLVAALQAFIAAAEIPSVASGAEAAERALPSAKAALAKAERLASEIAEEFEQEQSS